MEQFICPRYDKDLSISKLLDSEGKRAIGWHIAICHITPKEMEQLIAIEERLNIRFQATYNQEN